MASDLTHVIDVTRAVMIVTTRIWSYRDEAAYTAASFGVAYEAIAFHRDWHPRPEPIRPRRGPATFVGTIAPEPIQSAAVWESIFALLGGAGRWRGGQ